MAPMPIEKTFFGTVYFRGIIYTFGGYDAYEKEQLADCCYYDTYKNQWFNSSLVPQQGKVDFKLNKPRS
jgi:hypothetical protein